MADTKNVSASIIRFLLAMKHLIDCGEDPGCVHLAKVLECTKPSVHKMMKVLDEKGMIHYRKRMVPTFTWSGLQVAQQYEMCYKVVCELLMEDNDGSDAVSPAVCAYLAELPACKLNALLKKKMEIKHE